jgi:phage-related protein
MITFDGVTSTSKGVTVEGYTKIAIPEKVVDSYEIPGKNGALLIDRGKYKNYLQKYTVHWLSSPGLGAKSLVGWAGKTGYKKLEDSFYPSYFRLASFRAETELDNRMNALGRATIIFDCKPQWFLNSGETEVTYINGNGGTLVNAGTEISFPYIRLVCLAGYQTQIIINGVTVTINVPSGTTEYETWEVIIDCEAQNIYKADGTNLNTYATITDGEFPSLDTGSNVISFEGQMISCFIKPRWWTLIPTNA